MRKTNGEITCQMRAPAHARERRHFNDNNKLPTANVLQSRRMKTNEKEKFRPKRSRRQTEANTNRRELRGTSAEIRHFQFGCFNPN